VVAYSLQKTGRHVTRFRRRAAQAGQQGSNVRNVLPAQFIQLNKRCLIGLYFEQVIMTYRYTAQSVAQLLL